MDAAALRQFEECEEFDVPPCAGSTSPNRAWSESELQFLTRRALEERRLAAEASTAAAAAAHLYLSASYSAKMADELSRLAELEKLALSIEV